MSQSGYGNWYARPLPEGAVEGFCLNLERVGALCIYFRGFEKASSIFAQREGSSPSAATELRTVLVSRMRKGFHSEVRALVQFLYGLTDRFCRVSVAAFSALGDARSIFRGGACHVEQDDKCVGVELP